MAETNKQKKTDQRKALYDWATPGKRVEWLLNARFAGNRSKMARAINFSHTAISKVVSGEKPPGGRMLTAIVEKLAVDAGWLLKGEGEPFGGQPDASDAVLWMPVSDRLLADKFPGQSSEPAGKTIKVPGLRPSSQYWFHLQRGEPILNHGALGFLRNDLLLMETDPARFPAEEDLSYELCAVKSPPGVTPAVKLCEVVFVAADDYDGPARVVANTFEPRTGEIVKEYVFRRLQDGTVEAEERFSRKKKLKGRDVYVPVRNIELTGPDVGRPIKYTDIVAVWTGILHRPSRIITE